MIIPVQQNYGFRISASPNPTSDDLNVTIDNETADVKALKKEENIKIDLIDFVTGTKRKSWSYKNVQNTFNLSVANLPKGQYVIRVSKGRYKQTKQIIIN
jgi:Secretion system C-terminal sorting domain